MNQFQMPSRALPQIWLYLGIELLDFRFLFAILVCGRGKRERARALNNRHG